MKDKNKQLFMPQTEKQLADTILRWSFIEWNFKKILNVVEVMTLFKQYTHSYMIRIGTNLDHLSLIHHFN